MQSEINDSMAYNPAESSPDYTTADLEEELSEILASGSDLPDISLPSGIQNPVSPCIGDTSISPRRSDTKASPSYINSEFPTVPAGPIGPSFSVHGSPLSCTTNTSPRDHSAHGLPLAYTASSSPRGQQYGYYRNISPGKSLHQHLNPQSGSGVLNKTYPFDDSSGLSQISGASSTMDSHALSSQSSDLDVLSQFEALKVMEGKQLKKKSFLLSQIETNCVSTRLYTVI